MISGKVPTPLGTIREKLTLTSASGCRGEFTLPANLSADLFMPVPTETANVTVNGGKGVGTLVEEKTRLKIHIEGPGTYRVNVDR